MQSDKEIQKLNQKFDFFKKNLHKERKEKFLFGENIFLSCLNKSASFINWFFANPIIIVSLLLIAKTISLNDVHQFIESNKAYFPELGVALFSIIISVEILFCTIKGAICPQDRIKQLIKRCVISLGTTFLTYKLIEVSWLNIASAI